MTETYGCYLSLPSPSCSIGSVPSGAMLLSQVTPLRMATVSLISVFVLVPIALDVMFTAQLHCQHITNGYVMLFLMTLGTYSIIPSIYLSGDCDTDRRSSTWDAC